MELKLERLGRLNLNEEIREEVKRVKRPFCKRQLKG